MEEHARTGSRTTRVSVHSVTLDIAVRKVNGDLFVRNSTYHFSIGKVRSFLIAEKCCHF